MPPGSEVSGDVQQERRRTPVFARLVTLALLAGAAAVLVTAIGHSHGPPRARVAANTTPSVVLPNGEPTLVQIMSASRVGDAILVRVDPVGAAGPQTLVVSPGARVAGSSLQTLLTSAADRRAAMHRTRYQLGYDASGAIVDIAPA